jgi:hypothetical protein
MKPLPLWKVTAERPLEMAEVLRIADGVAAATDAAAAMQGVELQRVDTTRGRTVVFVASSPEGAKALAAALGGKLDQASADDLRTPGPAAE